MNTIFILLVALQRALCNYDDPCALCYGSGLNSGSGLSTFSAPPVASPPQLAENTYNTFTGMGNHFIMYYSDICNPCKEFAPFWNGLGTVYGADDRITISRVECNFSPICPTYPLIQFKRNGTEIESHRPNSVSHQQVYNIINNNLCRDAPKETMDHVPPLNNHNYKKLMESNNPVFVKYATTSCDPRLTPMWNELYIQLLKSKINITRVTCDSNQGTNVFPAIELLLSFKFVARYSGYGTKETLHRFMSENLDDSFKPELTAAFSHLNDTCAGSTSHIIHKYCLLLLFLIKCLILR